MTRMRPLTSFLTTMAAETCRAGALLLLSLTRAFNFLDHVRGQGRRRACAGKRKEAKVDRQTDGCGAEDGSHRPAEAA